MLDKLAHVGAGSIASFLVYAFLPEFYGIQAVALSASIIAGIGKEVYDWYTKKTWDVWDLVATIIGGCLVVGS